jgi:hypothetical protein
VKAKPVSASLVAFTLRGYDGSDPFKDEDMATGQAITNSMGLDFISIVNYVVERLAVLSTEGSSLTILSWSLGAALVVAGYCHGCNLERVGAVGLARRCSEEQELSTQEWSIYMVLWANCLAYTLSRLASSEYVEVTGLTRDSNGTLLTIDPICGSRMAFLHL